MSRRLSKRMGAEFTKLIQRKGLMDETSQYLPRLLAWVNEKIVFWQSELGATLVQGYKAGTKRSFAVTSDFEGGSKDIVKKNNN